MDAFQAAFKTTPILLRYPTDSSDGQAPNANRPFGYHDDSFAWATLHTDRPDDSWFYQTLLKTPVEAPWKNGKLSPLAAKFGPKRGARFSTRDPQTPRFKISARASRRPTRVGSWTADFLATGAPTNARRATREVRRLGYEFWVRVVDIGSVSRKQLPVSVEVENRGVALFYYAWRNQFAIADARGQIVKIIAGRGLRTGLLPSQPARGWNQNLDVTGLAPGKYQLLMRVRNSLPNGIPLRFANTAQDANVAGWLTLGEWSLR